MLAISDQHRRARTSRSSRDAAREPLGVEIAQAVPIRAARLSKRRSASTATARWRTSGSMSTRSSSATSAHARARDVLEIAVADPRERPRRRRRARNRTSSAAPIAAMKPHMSSQNGRKRVFHTACSGHSTKNTPNASAISSSTSVDRRRYQPARDDRDPGEDPDPPRQPQRGRDHLAGRASRSDRDAAHDPLDRVLHRIGQEDPVRQLEVAAGREHLGVAHALRVRLLAEQRQRPHRR